MSDNHLKFLFVSIMVVLALIGRNDRSTSPVLAEQPSIVRLSSKPINSNISFDNKINRSAAVSLQVEDFLPVRKNNLPEPFLNVESAVAKDLDSDFDFYRLNSDINWPIASLTKLMSSVVAVEKVGLEKKVVISDIAIATEGVAGDFSQDEVYRVGELLKAMLVASSNDAAVAVADFYGSDNFIKQMREKALELEMNQTSFMDPTGLSAINQSTVEDLEKLVSHIYKNHLSILKISDQPEVTLFEESQGSERKLLNINNFVHSRPEFIGGKTGYTDQAKGNLISIFSYKGHNILVIVLGTDDRFGQTDILYNWVKEAYSF